MSDQLTLDGQTETPTPKLTDRQRYALELVRDLGPVPDDELGAHMHERLGKHSAETRCAWCGEAGRGIGKELRKKRLVRELRTEGWYVPGRKPQRPVEGEYDPATASFPEGF